MDRDGLEVTTPTELSASDYSAAEVTEQYVFLFVNLDTNDSLRTQAAPQPGRTRTASSENKLINRALVLGRRERTVSATVIRS